MGVHDAFLAGAIIVLALIVKFPEQYRRGMARLCSVEVESLSPISAHRGDCPVRILRVYASSRSTSLRWLAINRDLTSNDRRLPFSGHEREAARHPGQLQHPVDLDADAA